MWIRSLLRRLAAEGRTVLVSSHLMGETASFADHLVILGRGRLLADTPVREFIHARVRPHVGTRTTEPAALDDLLAHGLDASPAADGAHTVRHARVELAAHEGTLVEAHLHLTAAEAEFTALPIRTLRSLVGGLAALLLATTAFSMLAAGDADGSDPLYSAFVGVSLGQIAAVAFGTTAVSAEFRGGALRLTPSAVPGRRRWFAAKATAIALPLPAVGLLTGPVTLLVGKSVLGASGPAWSEGLRGAVGCGLT